MTMRLFPGHRTDCRSTVLRTLMDTSLYTAQIAKQIFTAEAQAATLIDKMNQVRGAGLSVAEFRGCTIGRVSENLAALKNFLGAAEVGAPDVLSTYGVVTPKGVLGVIGNAQDRAEEARKEDEECLRIFRELVQKNPETNLPCVNGNGLTRLFVPLFLIPLSKESCEFFIHFSTLCNQH